MGDIKHTEFASKALGLVQLFNMIVAEPLAGKVTYRVELAAPDGPSTGGGKQATQHIKLVPEGGGQTLVGGSANQAAKTAELRTYAYLAQQHAARFGGQELTLGKPAWDALVEKLTNFFKTQGLTVTVTDAEPMPGVSVAQPAEAAGSPQKWMAIGAAAALAVAAVAFLALR